MNTHTLAEALYVEPKTESNITMGKESVSGMLNGIKAATKLIRTTYGPSGLNVSVESEFYPFHQVANDAQTILQAIQVEGATEKRGLNFLKELMDQANKDSGDGRKTTCIIAEEIIERANIMGISGNLLKKKLDSFIPIIEKSIDGQKENITSEDGRVEFVASIAGESVEIGRTLNEIYKHIGKDGIIIPEPSGTYETSYSFIEGVRFVDTGFLSPFMVHDEDAAKADGVIETRAIYVRPLILVTKKKIGHINDIDPLLRKMQQLGKKDLVIFTDDMDSGVASILVNTHKARIMNILIIKAPVLWKNYVFEDFARITGSTIVEDASGVNFKNLQLDHLGTCGKITVDKDETVVIGIEDIRDHMASLALENTDDSKLRLSWLNVKTAILKIGANNESELSYKRLKCYDAINSSRLALKDGVVSGAGWSLYVASKDLPDTQEGELLRQALTAPMKQNMENMGIEDGFDGRWFGKDVIDSSIVVKNAVRNAISLASTVLTLGGDVALPKKSADQIAAESLQAKGMRF